jgi:hypothetical protein
MPAVTESSPASYRLLREVEAPTLEAVNKIMQKEGPLTDSETLKIRQLDQDTRRYLRECMASSTPVHFGEQALQVRSENTSKLSTLKEAVELHVQHKKQVRVNLPLENLKKHTLAELMDLAHFLKERQGILKNPEVISSVFLAIRSRAYTYRELLDIVHIHSEYNEPMTLRLKPEALAQLSESKLVELHSFVTGRMSCLKNPEVITTIRQAIGIKKPAPITSEPRSTAFDWARNRDEQVPAQRKAEVAAVQEIRSKTGWRGLGKTIGNVMGKLWGKRAAPAENEWASASA